MEFKDKASAWMVGVLIFATSFSIVGILIKLYKADARDAAKRAATVYNYQLFCYAPINFNFVSPFLTYCKVSDSGTVYYQLDKGLTVSLSNNTCKCLVDTVYTGEIEEQNFYNDNQ